MCYLHIRIFNSHYNAGCCWGSRHWCVVLDWGYYCFLAHRLCTLIKTRTVLLHLGDCSNVVNISPTTLCATDPTAATEYACLGALGSTLL
jgi:hypothetical protein